MITLLRNFVLIVMLCAPIASKACTIFCGKDKQGHIWAANNEDNPFNFYNYLNVFPKTEDTKYGYFTLSYNSTKNGENFNIQGGMNEAGLFYDFNTIPPTLIKALHKKKVFPQGSQKILSHILANMETVEEVIAFFEKYWFEVGFNSAQMHIADKYGTFGIVGPSGSRILKNQRYQVSTNFDICGKGDSSSCWRYPIAVKKLAQGPINLTSFRDLCKATSFKGKGGTYTIYSNIQNLNTGEVWFYYLSDYQNPFKTSISTLLAKGRKSYLIRDLFKKHPISVLYNDFNANGGASAFKKFESLNISKARKKEIASIFVNNILANHSNMETLPFLEEYLQHNPVGYWMRAARAIAYYQKGDQQKAISIIKAYKKEVPETSMNVKKILNLFEGKFPEGANTTIELNGYPNAKHVFVKGLPVDFDFLIKKEGKWIGKYKLNEGVYNYSFVIDGKKVFDHKTPVKTISSIFEPSFLTHQLCIGLSKDTYLTTIKVKVPNKEDVVYIAGNQRAMTYWNSVFRLKKVSDFEREITLELHLPAKFKFTRGNWESEALMKNNTKDKNGRWLPMEIHLNADRTSYTIVNWKDRVK